MMPTSFAESNLVLDKPADKGRDECEPLCVWRGDSVEGIPLVISCWKLTREELEEITRTGRLYLTVYGRTMPPVALAVGTPFTEAT
jgi:hypothetical protein